MSKTTRLLSLILVIAMAFSLFAVGGSAKWADDAANLSDYASVNYQEAAKVLTYINVIDGIDGAFKPEGTLQRDAAAKIITRLVTGVKADDIVPTNTIFTDVPATQWASGYVQWAYNNNIISGKGNNEFRPLESVTVLQFLKMILTGLGWGAQGEFTGKGWDTAVYIKATELGLWGDVEPVLVDRPATREEAMEFSLQALLQYPVVYGTTYDYKTYDGAAFLSKTAAGNKAELYHVHGIALENGEDNIGYLTYKWVDAKTNGLIYEGYSAWQKQVLVSSSLKASTLTEGLTGNISDKYTSGAHLGETYSTVEIRVNGYDATEYYYDGVSYKAVYDLVKRLSGAKVTEYAVDRTLTRVVIEIQVLAFVDQINEKNGTYRATVEDEYTSAGFSGSFPYTSLKNTEGYANGDIITVVPSVSAITDEAGDTYRGFKEIDIKGTSKYPKAVLKTYKTGTLTGYTGYTYLDPYNLKFGTTTAPTHFAWIGTENFLDTQFSIEADYFFSFGTFITDSNGFLIAYDPFVSASPVRYAYGEIDALSSKGQVNSYLYPAYYDFTAATYTGLYIALNSNFALHNGAKKTEYADEITWRNAKLAFGRNWGIYAYYDGEPGYWSSATSSVSTPLYPGDPTGYSEYTLDTTYSAGAYAAITVAGKTTNYLIASDAVILLKGVAVYDTKDPTFMISPDKQIYISDYDTQKLLDKATDEDYAASFYITKISGKSVIGAIELTAKTKVPNKKVTALGDVLFIDSPYNAVFGTMPVYTNIASGEATATIGYSAANGFGIFGILSGATSDPLDYVMPYYTVTKSAYVQGDGKNGAAAYSGLDLKKKPLDNGTSFVELTFKAAKGFEFDDGVLDGTNATYNIEAALNEWLFSNLGALPEVTFIRGYNYTTAVRTVNLVSGQVFVEKLDTYGHFRVYFFTDDAIGVVKPTPYDYIYPVVYGSDDNADNLTNGLGDIDHDGYVRLLVDNDVRFAALNAGKVIMDGRWRVYVPAPVIIDVSELDFDLDAAHPVPFIGKSPQNGFDAAGINGADYAPGTDDFKFWVSYLVPGLVPTYVGTNGVFENVPLGTKIILGGSITSALTVPAPFDATTGNTVFPTVDYWIEIPEADFHRLNGDTYSAGVWTSGSGTTRADGTTVDTSTAYFATGDVVGYYLVGNTLTPITDSVGSILLDAHSQNGKYYWHGDGQDHFDDFQAVNLPANYYVEIIKVATDTQKLLINGSAAVGLDTEKFLYDGWSVNIVTK